jgi:CheY-like chemotaxis protein
VAARRILVVEDEFLIALDIAGALEQAGLHVIGPHATTAEALKAIESEEVHGALLDANLEGEPVNALADVLVRRKIPFAFVSGYGREQLPTEHRAVPLIKKPFVGTDLLTVVRKFAAQA